MKPLLWATNTAQLLALLDDNLSDVAAGGHKRSEAYKRIASSLSDTRTGNKYTSRQVSDKLRQLCLYHSKNRKFESLLSQGSTYLNWKDHWSTRSSESPMTDVQTTPPDSKSQQPSPRRRGSSQDNSNVSQPLESLQIDRHAIFPRSEALRPTSCSGRRSNNSTNAMLELQLTSDFNYSIPANDCPYSEDPELLCDLKGDEEIAKDWATLALKIREASSVYLDCIDKQHLREPRLPLIQNRYPDLCSLFRILFGCTGVDSLSIEVKRKAWNIPVGYLDTFRALIACGVLEWVFRRPLQNRYFEECRQRGVYNEGRIRRALPEDPDSQAQIEKDAASYPSVRKKEITQRADELSDRMENSLKALILQPYDDSDCYYVSGLPPEDLEAVLAALKQVFEKSIALKVDLWRKGGVVDYIWSVPLTDKTENWDPRLMDLEHDHPKGHRGQVAMCLHPAVQVTQSASARGLGRCEDEKETVILGKGLVILRP
ncbi:hypothetical protein MMC18_007019 [Xylographa bjoerkii]|nr:hypothetical protein [Xylographa bjoerkii]